MAGSSSISACWGSATPRMRTAGTMSPRRLVVEWRALTVALLDRLAALVRTRLRRNAHQLPLARILQGGTWAAGRILARRLRPDGAPPVAVISDGTVF